MHDIRKRLPQSVQITTLFQQLVHCSIYDVICVCETCLMIL